MRQTFDVHVSQLPMCNEVSWDSWLKRPSNSFADTSASDVNVYRPMHRATRRIVHWSVNYNPLISGITGGRQGAVAARHNLTEAEKAYNSAHNNSNILHLCCTKIALFVFFSCSEKSIWLYEPKQNFIHFPILLPQFCHLCLCENTGWTGQENTGSKCCWRQMQCH